MSDSGSTLWKWSFKKIYINNFIHLNPEDCQITNKQKIIPEYPLFGVEGWCNVNMNFWGSWCDFFVINIVDKINSLQILMITCVLCRLAELGTAHLVTAVLAVPQLLPVLQKF